MRTEDFDFYLPDALIAQHPTKSRTASRLLYLNEKTGLPDDQLFLNLPTHLNAGDLVIFNDTRVIKARLYGNKASGGAVEVLIERVLDPNHALAHIRASRAPVAGTVLSLANAFKAEVIGRNDDLFQIKFLSDTTVFDLLEQHGALPLPPYISHNAEAEDEDRYQTVYAKHAGAIAAPTAGLHFDEAMLSTLKNKGVNIAYVTLHVGAGTFQPVRVDSIKDHQMHSEIYHIPPETADLIERTKTLGNKIIAVGTTSMRTLESAALRSSKMVSSANDSASKTFATKNIAPEANIHEASGAASNMMYLDSDALSGETDIFITPGFEFKIVDKLITNFHLPKSTLLMLVSAFAGFDEIKNAYAHAVKQEYRFFSYGDAMLLERKTTTK